MIWKVFALCSLIFSCFATPSYRLEFDEGKWKFFDPNDFVYEKEGVPFLVLYQGDQTEILEIGKTENFSGQEILSIAKTYQGETEMTLTDTALSLPCKWDGKWCEDQALMDLKMTGVFVHGQTYYESLGAESPDPDFRLCARFIHEMPLEVLISALDEFKPGYSALLKKIAQHLALQTSNSTVGKLSHLLYRASKKSPDAHILWHLFYDQIIADKGHLAADYIARACQTKDLPDPLLARLLSIVKKERDQLIQLGYRLDQNCTEYRLCQFHKKLEACNHLPALFLISRATDAIILQTVKTQYLLEDNSFFEKVHIQASQMEAESKWAFDPRFPIACWIIAKDKVKHTRVFQFKAPK